MTPQFENLFNILYYLTLPLALLFFLLSYVSFLFRPAPHIYIYTHTELLHNHAEVFDHFCFFINAAYSANRPGLASILITIRLHAYLANKYTFPMVPLATARDLL